MFKMTPVYPLGIQERLLSLCFLLRARGIIGNVEADEVRQRAKHRWASEEKNVVHNIQALSVPPNCGGNKTRERGKKDA